MKKRIRFGIMAGVAGCMVILGNSAIVAAEHRATGGQYEVVKHITLGGDGGWDYATYDAPGNRLFVARATRMMVIDPDKGSLIAEIPNAPGVHGVAFDYKAGKGYISNGKENSIIVFDLKTLKESERIKINGQNPDTILFDSFSKRIFTLNGRSSDATVIDTESAKVIGTIALSGKPEFAVSDGKGNIFVNIEDKSEVSCIDPKNMKVTRTWSIAPGQEPSGLAFDPKTRRLFSVCDNKLMIVSDADAGKVVAKVPIGEGPDGATFDAERRLVFSSNGESGTLTIVHEDAPDKYSVVQNLDTQKSARTIALNPKTHTLYLPAAEFEPAAAGAEQPRRHRTVKPGSFNIVVVGLR